MGVNLIKPVSDYKSQDVLNHNAVCTEPSMSHLALYFCLPCHFSPASVKTRAV